MASVLVDNIAAGISRQEILRSYPALVAADIEAALAYAAELTREGTVSLPLETRALNLKSTKICRLNFPSFSVEKVFKPILLPTRTSQAETTVSLLIDAETRTAF